MAAGTKWPRSKLVNKTQLFLNKHIEKMLYAVFQEISTELNKTFGSKNHHGTKCIISTINLFAKTMNKKK